MTDATGPETGQAPNDDSPRGSAPIDRSAASSAHGLETAQRPVRRPPTRVLLVDDHRAFSEALAMAISSHPDLACVGTPATIRDCLMFVRYTGPDVVLLDVRLPDGDGIDAIAKILALDPGARIVVMTGYTDVDVIARAASLGASGFLPKESPVSAVIAAIRGVAGGEMLIDRATLAALVGSRRRAVLEPREMDGVAGSLTARELDVLNLMGEGLDPHAIAKMLVISLHTCRGYEKSIMAKLDAHSQLQAVVVAARRGLIGGLGG